MKKALALLCALILVLTLAVPCAGADHSGSAAVFDEDAYVRATLAQLAVYAQLGDDADTVLAASVTESPFRDVASSAAYAPAVAYCAERGILNGYGDGSFAPNAPATGYAVAKAALVSAGYGQRGEFDGPAWQTSVAEAAKSTGLLTGGTGNVVILTDLPGEASAPNGGTINADSGSNRIIMHGSGSFDGFFSGSNIGFGPSQSVTEKQAKTVVATAVFQIPVVELSAAGTYEIARNDNGTVHYLADKISAVSRVEKDGKTSFVISYADAVKANDTVVSILTPLVNDSFGVSSGSHSLPNYYYHTFTEQELFDIGASYAQENGHDSAFRLKNRTNHDIAEISSVTDPKLKEAVAPTGSAVCTVISLYNEPNRAGLWISVFPWEITVDGDKVTATQKRGNGDIDIDTNTVTCTLEKHSIRVAATDYTVAGFTADGQQFLYAGDFKGDRIYGGGYDVWTLPQAVTDEMGLEKNALYALYAVDTEPEQDSSPSVYTPEIYVLGFPDEGLRYLNLSSGTVETAPWGTERPGEEGGYQVITVTDGRITAVTGLSERAEYEQSELPRLPETVPIYVMEYEDPIGNTPTRIQLSDLVGSGKDYYFDILYTDGGRDFPACVIAWPGAY